MDLSIETSHDGDHVLLILSGALDLESRVSLLAAGQAALADESVNTLTLDMDGIAFIDSTGLGALVDLSRDAEDREAVFAIRNPSSRVRRVLDMTGLSGHWSATAEQ